jgi:DNA-binding MarR family transcriptional regulator
MPHDENDREISLLEVLRTQPDAGQRDMAEAIGLSLGMTNLLLKELSAKGWMLMRKLNTRKVQYVLTPEGLKELSRRSYRYLKKSIRNMAECRVQLEALVQEAKVSGSLGLLLIGVSEVDFVLDHLCRQHGVLFVASTDDAARPGWFVVHGENEPALSPNVLEYMDRVAPSALYGGS